MAGLPPPAQMPGPTGTQLPVTGTTEQDIQNAIHNAATQYQVPTDVLAFVRLHESGNATGDFQRTVTNPQGYGGFFGLPAADLGTLQDQANIAAQTLAYWYNQLGQGWQAAIHAFNAGPNAPASAGYASQYDGSNSTGTVPAVPNPIGNSGAANSTGATLTGSLPSQADIVPGCPLPKSALDVGGALAWVACVAGKELPRALAIVVGVVMVILGVFVIVLDDVQVKGVSLKQTAKKVAE